MVNMLGSSSILSIHYYRAGGSTKVLGLGLDIFVLCHLESLSQSQHVAKINCCGFSRRLGVIVAGAGIGT